MQFVLTSTGSHLVVREPDGTVRVRPTGEPGPPDVSLGKRSPLVALDETRWAILTVGDDGLRAISLAGDAARTLVADPIDVSTLRFGADAAWFARGGDLWRVPLDGSTPPALAQPGGIRLLFVAADGAIAYSKDRADR